jgi:poly-gamma-glutamate synthase PgsB/CapB
MGPSVAIGLSALGGYAACLALERLFLRLARRRLRVVVHVNGTRGKSAVTRMVYAVLREAGYQVWGKTTGTEPRLLLPDGRETRIRRLGPANVREQRNMLLRAVLAGADALVFECNAVRPELQLVSSAFLDPDLVVITNARTDHRPEQGTADEAAFTYAASISPGRAVATSDSSRRAFWEGEAVRRGARFFYAGPAEGEGLADLPENAACALAAADWLGLSRDRAVEAIASHRRDPGAFRLLSWRYPGGPRVWFADASAANDPESTDRLFVLAAETAAGEGMADARRVLAVANRPDRPDRALQFAEYASTQGGPAGAFDETVFLGPLPLAARAVLGRSGIRYRTARGPEDILPERLRRDHFIVAAGNRIGPGKALRDWALARASTGEPKTAAECGYTIAEREDGWGGSA